MTPEVTDEITMSDRICMVKGLSSEKEYDLSSIRRATKQCVAVHLFIYFVYLLSQTPSTQLFAPVA